MYLRMMSCRSSVSNQGRLVFLAPHLCNWCYYLESVHVTLHKTNVRKTTYWRGGEDGASLDKCLQCYQYMPASLDSAALSCHFLDQSLSGFCVWRLGWWAAVQVINSSSPVDPTKFKNPKDLKVSVFWWSYYWADLCSRVLFCWSAWS